ncbi:MAG: endonuclease [Microbacteriaceae bacterium]|nr:endonuclease [Microbacteriaceae bacterium]
MNHLPEFVAAAAAWAQLTPPADGELSDADLIVFQRHFADVRRTADLRLAQMAGITARRSRPELGSDGLAQRTGARTPEQYVQQVTGVSRREAGTLVRVGELMDAASASPDSLPGGLRVVPWLHAVTNAVEARVLTTGAADVIRAALTGIDLADDALLDAANTLIHDAKFLSEEKLTARARQVRDRLDEDGVAEREEALREKRCLHLYPQPDGTTRISGVLDPESAAGLTAAIDAATSPRRGGPRFVDPTARDRAQRLLDDPRTTPQIALDALVDLVKLGVASDSAHIVGTYKPTVRLHVTARDLDRRAGAAQFEGQTASVSIETAERHMCADGFVPILFNDDGVRVLNLGRSQRLYSARQRTALEARDGGCRFPDCDRPPGWTEAHHINEWDRDHGRTDVADGILLCRHHHLLIHNNGWQVKRTGADYFVVPPRSLDPEQVPIPAPPKGVASVRAA